MAKTKEQVQIMVLGAILAGGALVAGVYFGLVPLITSYRESRDNILEIESKLETARRFTQKAGEFRAEYRDALFTIEEQSKHIPKPVLGNYLLDMDLKLRECTEDVDVNIQDIDDGGIIDLAPDSLFQLYKVRVNGFTGTAELMKLFDNIYNMNPLVAITDLSINPDETDPMKHRISFAVSWLIWKTPFDMPEYITDPPLLEEESELSDSDPEQEDAA